jgi:hypothetical protein
MEPGGGVESEDGSYFGSQIYKSLILGPLLARIYCEIIIVFFRINGHLRAIEHNTQRV